MNLKLRVLTSSKTPIALEPYSDADDSGQVYEAEAKTSADADGHNERDHVVRKS